MKTRLQALTLAAVVAATVLTGGAAISGITRRAAQPVAAAPAPAQVVVSAPARPAWHEERD